MPIVRGVVVCTLALIYFFVGMWLWSLFVSWSMDYFGWGIAFLWTGLIFAWGVWYDRRWPPKAQTVEESARLEGRCLEDQYERPLR